MERHCVVVIVELLFIVASYDMHETYAVVVINFHIRSTHVIVYHFYVCKFGDAVFCIPKYADSFAGAFLIDRILVMLSGV